MPSVNLQSFFSRPSPPSEARTVTAGIPDSHFCDNALISSKYTWLNMLPKATFEQFRRLSNFYFLIVAAISYIPNISPSSPVTTTLPLLVVIGFGLARDVYEDTLRKRADKLTNNRPVLVCTPNPSSNAAPSAVSSTTLLDSLSEHPSLDRTNYTPIRSRDVRVGHVLLLFDDDHVPADVILLSSAHSSSEAFVSTANLDGESNLKRRRAPPSDAPSDALEAIATVSAPTSELYQLEGSLRRPESSLESPLDQRNLLLRGSVLRNTPYAHGLVVYAGHDTKLALNMRDPPSKLGGVERMMNRVVIALFGVLLILTVITSAIAGSWQSTSGASQWYMGENRFQSGVSVGLRSLGTYIILYHTFVPVSLFVTLEFVRLVQGLFISWDSKMISPDGKGADVRANNLNESLGYIDHVFSDKTGTLTQNVMRFVAADVPDGSSYGTGTGPDSFHQATSNSSDAKRLAVAIAVAHDVVPAHKPGHERVEYQGESVDEVALVEGARNAQVSLLSRSDDSLVVDVVGNEEAFEPLATLEFSSERKRMSIILRDSNGVVRIITKGADSVMAPLLLSTSDSDVACAAADSLSRKGLRTLVFGERALSNEEYESWSAEFHEACNAMDERSDRKAKVAAKVEQGLELLGVTGVEDRLQDAVPDSIVFMRKAGIRIWVLTGDKVETAENIGYSSLLLNRDMEVTLARCSKADELSSLLQDAVLTQGSEDNVELDEDEKKTFSSWSFGWAAPGKKNREYAANGDHAIIIDGDTLGLITTPALEQLFLNATMGCRTVICARVTPLQKARVVKLVRQYEGVNTLAIGDGGNDVSMIQEAHIGVGIKGKEGSQAARAADYALSEFRHLVRLLAVHGRFSYVRTTGVINLSFYKNVFFSFTQFLFQFFCFASGTTFHNQWIVTAWNSILTLAPPFIYGIFERDLEEETVLRFAEVYDSNRGNRLFSLRTVMEFTIAYSVWHGLVLFWLVYFAFGDVERIVWQDGRDAGFYLTGLALSTMAVCIALFKFLLSSHLWTRVVIGGVTVSFLLLWGLIALFPVLFHELELEGVLDRLWRSPSYHLLWPVVFVTAFIPDFAVRLVRSMRFTLVERLQVLECREKKMKKG